MDTKNNTEREQWINNIARQRKSGLSPKEWCRQNHKRVPEFDWWERLLQAEGYVWGRKDTVEFRGKEYTLESMRQAIASAGSIREFCRLNGSSSREFAIARNKLLLEEYDLDSSTSITKLRKCAIDDFNSRGAEWADDWCIRHCMLRQTIYRWMRIQNKGNDSVEESTVSESNAFELTWRDLEAFAFSGKSVVECCKECKIDFNSFSEQRKKLLCNKYGLGENLSDKEFVQEFKSILSSVPASFNKDCWLRLNGIDQFTQKCWGIHSEEKEVLRNVNELTLNDFRRFAASGKTVTEYCSENGFSELEFEKRRQQIIVENLGFRPDVGYTDYKDAVCNLVSACHGDDERDTWLIANGIDQGSYNAWMECLKEKRQCVPACLQVRIGDAEFTVNSVESVNLLQGVVSALSEEAHKWKYV